MKRGKKILGMLLAVALLLGCLPMAASAASTLGEVVVPLQYDAVRDFQEGLAAVQRDVGEQGGLIVVDQWGFVDKTGKEVIVPQYNGAYSFSEGLAAVKTGDKWGFIDKTGKEIVLPKYDNVWPFSEGLAAVKTGSKWGFIDKTGKEIVSPKYDDVRDFHDGLAAVSTGSIDKASWGYIDKTGQEAISQKYGRAYDFSEGVAVVHKKTGDTSVDPGMIDKTGKEIVPFGKYLWLEDCHEGRAAFLSADGQGLMGYLDKTGKEVIPAKYDTMSDPSLERFAFHDGLALVWKPVVRNGKEDTDVVCIDKTGKELFVAPSDSYLYTGMLVEGMFAIGKIMGTETTDWGSQDIVKYGCADKAGKIVVPYKYDHVFDFSEGYAAVFTKDLGYGFVDKTGREVVAPQYTDVSRENGVSEGMAAVSTTGEDSDEKWGFISLSSTSTPGGNPGGNPGTNPTPPIGGDPVIDDPDDDPPVGTTFIDVPAGVFYEDAVNWAVELGITTGTSTTTFSPNTTCTRAQVVTFLWRAAGSPEPAGAVANFSDVKAGAYYEKAVAWAVEKGITTGTGNDKFSPEAPCTRAQTVTFQWRAAGNPSASVSSFSDVAENEFYTEAVNWAVEKEITVGTGNNRFSPSARCSRSQVVTFLYRAK